MFIVPILFERICMMFLLMFVGMLMFKTGKITEKGSKDMGHILIYIVIPAVVFKSCLSEYSNEKLLLFLWSFGLSAAALIVTVVVSAVFFKKSPIENFGTAFSNVGFVSVPLIEATLGSEALFYAAPIVGLLNFMQWTYGVYIITGDRKAISMKKVITNPVLIALLLGIIFFISGIKLPKAVTGSLDMISAANAPIAMLCLGSYLAQTDFKGIFTDITAYKSCVFRLLIIPILTIAAMTVFPFSGLVENAVSAAGLTGGGTESAVTMARLAVLIGAAAPVGMNVAIFAQIHGKDYPQAVKSICLSTLFSIISMPVVVGLGNMVWG